MDESEFIRELGKTIKKIRKMKSFTQSDLSLLTGIEESNLSRIESGKTNPTSATLHIIATSLQVKVRDFFEFEQLTDQ